MFTLAEFNNLSPRQQAGLVLEQGRYLHHIVRGWCKIDLYWFQNFYVEIWFLYDLKTIGLVRVLTNKASLDPYLATIKLKVHT
ncbi:hypothetical protein H9Q13_08245 [Pontibacter sp. JH31]|uniref:Uncharacterized protein n=1 Tax=Pontibacter aquaedesilientis TaxID=2766980 RepID=A0ABR7XFT4_9BACT|nr:hypothetical protein [Pontibacter aquaedesilientis]MBD1397150.1 hypothetical protein [Pontibacter aquaedesilientis]